MLAKTQENHPDGKNAAIKSTLVSLLLPEDGQRSHNGVTVTQNVTNLFLCCVALASADGDEGPMMSWITKDLSSFAAMAVTDLSESVYSEPNFNLLELGGGYQVLCSNKALDLTIIGRDRRLLLDLMPTVLPMLKDAIKSSCSSTNEDELDASFASTPVSSAVIAAHQMRWCLKQVKHPYLGPLSALVMPCALTSLDHWSPEVKGQGMTVFIHLARNLNSTELCWYKDVILDAACRNIAGSDQLWKSVVEMAVTLVICMEGRNPRAYWYRKILDEMLGELERHSEDKEHRIIWLQHIEPLFEAMGIVIVAYFRRLFPLFFHWLHAKDDATVILVLQRFLTITKLTWMRNTLYVERLVEELMIAYKGSSMRKSGADIRTSVVQVLTVLQSCKGQQFEAAWRKYKDDSILKSLPLTPEREKKSGVGTMS
eukprot:Gb_12768 [translate_table: standard]